jgi:anaerobic selenocysteine-containing dehydrogenase
MDAEQRITFCRICEAACGLVATVEDGRVTALRPDPAHPLSWGFACPKGIAMTEVQNDPDRVLSPLRRVDGRLEPCSWDDAIADIGGRLRSLRDREGLSAAGWYMGNPSAFSSSHPLWVKGFLDAIGSRHYYTASSQDVSNRFAASALLYGSPVVVPIPDLERTSLLLMVGANPLVSHGSLLTAPRIRERLNAIVERGGRVVVADPRRSETARAFEHLPVRPDSDAWLLLSLLHVLFAEDRVDRDALRRQARDADWLEDLAARFPPPAAAERSGVAPGRIRELARALSEAEGAAVYGRTGSCLGRFGTLVAYLLDALNVATGNLDRPGGAVFGHAAISLDDVAHRAGLATYDSHRSRVGDLPEVLGSLPASLMAREITEPGEGQLRALFVSAGNPVLSVPDGRALEAALAELELLVSIDFYVNETAARHADYVLPATTFLERGDMPLALMGFAVRPYVQWSDPVVEPAGEAREEWEIIDALSRELGVVPLTPAALRRLPGPLARRVTPERLLDLLLRTGPDGDWFGLRRGGLSLGRLRREPSGVALRDEVPTGVLRDKVRHPGGRVRLRHAAIGEEVERLAADGPGDGEFPLRLIGLRELRSHNSWMHNSPKLMAGDRSHSARVHPADAERVGVGEGEPLRIVSASGSVEVAARLTDEVMEGVVALPHGWGHAGGWRRANAAGGVNSNELASAAPEDLEPLAGMAHLNGIPVRLEAVAGEPGERGAAGARAAVAQ